MSINLRGVWSCMKFELQQMREQGSGAMRQLLLAWRSYWRKQAWNLSCRKAWSDWIHQERGT